MTEILDFQLSNFVQIFFAAREIHSYKAATKFFSCIKTFMKIFVHIILVLKHYKFKSKFKFANVWKINQKSGKSRGWPNFRTILNFFAK